MRAAPIKLKGFGIGLSILLAATINLPVFADDGGRKTAEQFAELYMKTFNASDVNGLRKLRYPVLVKSEMQEMIDGITEGSMKEGKKYTKFEILPITEDLTKPNMGPDGVFYEPNMTPTNMMKLSMVETGGSMSTTFPIGIKDGVYYEVGIIPSTKALPAFAFGWQRFGLPDTNWSLMMPNEAEPGKASLQTELGKDGVLNADAYGVMKNTADIKTTQHWIRCGEEGKRVNDAGNEETFRAACTTFEPDTLAKWFSDPKKNLEDAVNSAAMQNQGTIIKKADLNLNGAPGQEYEIKDKNGALRLGRVYWVKDGLYELSFVSKKANPDKESANKFLSSLEVK